MCRFLSFLSSQTLLLVGIAVGLCGCQSNNQSSASDGTKPSRAKLVCHRTSSGPIMSMFSFSLARPVTEAAQAEFSFYFDGDDCAGGGIVGHHDEKGWLFPLGHRDWPDLRRGENVLAGADSTEGVTPITKAQEGSAFWVGTVSGRYAVVRITDVASATYQELMDGKTAGIEFEWIWR
jgi:hypothetical protein